MPNNNPQGHNQYTKPEHRSTRASSKGAKAPERSNRASTAEALQPDEHLDEQLIERDNDREGDEARH